MPLLGEEDPLAGTDWFSTLTGKAPEPALGEGLDQPDWFDRVRTKGPKDYAQQVASSSVSQLGGTVGGILKGTTRGLHSVAEKVAPLVNDYPPTLEESPTFQGGQALQEKSAAAIPQVPGLEQSFWASKVPGAVAGSLPLLATAPLGLPGMMLAGGALAGEGAYEEAKVGGASEEDAERAFWVNALLQAPLEAAPMERLIRGARALKKAGGFDIIKAVKQAGIQYGAERATETLQAGVQEINAKVSYDPGREWAEIRSKMNESGELGGVAGAILGGGVALGAQALGGKKKAGAPAAPTPEAALESPDWFQTLTGQAPAAAIPRDPTGSQPAPDQGPPPGFPGTEPAKNLDPFGPISTHLDMTGADPRSIAEQEAALAASQAPPEGDLAARVAEAQAVEEELRGQRETFRQTEFAPITPEQLAASEAKWNAPEHQARRAEIEQTVLQAAASERPDEAAIQAEVERLNREGVSNEEALAKSRDVVERFTGQRPLEPRPGTAPPGTPREDYEGIVRQNKASIPQIEAEIAELKANPVRKGWTSEEIQKHQVDLKNQLVAHKATVADFEQRIRALSGSPSPAAAPLKPEPISGTAAQTPLAPTGEGGAAAASLQSPQEAAGRAQEEEAYLSKFQADVGVAVKRVQPQGDPEITYLEERAAQSDARIVWFDPGKGRVPAGAHMKKGLIFLDVTRPEQARRYVFHHELFHELEKRFPDIAKRLREVMRRADPKAFAERGAKYLKSFEGSPIQIQPGQVESESGAVSVEDLGGYLDAAMRTPEDLQAAIEAEPGLWGAIADALLKILRRIGVYRGKTFQHRARLKALSEFQRTDYEKSGIKPNQAAQIALEIKQAFDLLTEEEAAPSEAAKAQQPGEFARYASQPQKKTDELGFFSQLERTIEQKLPARASSKQVLDVAKGGAKAEELEYSGLAQFLEGKGSVKKEDVLAFLRENNVTVTEVTKGGAALTTEERPRFDAPVGFPPRETKFQNYQLPGGENYRELLLTLPGGRNEADGKRLGEIGRRLEDIQDTFDSYHGGDTPAVHRARAELAAEKEALKTEQRELAAKADAAIPKTFTGGHFDEPNVLAHVRFNERKDSEGRRVLFLEEVQSDWHQKGRKQGYKGRVDTSGWTVKPSKTPRVFHVHNAAGEDLGAAHWGGDPADVQGIIGEWKKNQFQPEPGVPDAPFKTSWHELALKRMLRYAADQGFDSVAWTTGEQQAERYDLSKQIKHIDWKRSRPFDPDRPTFDVYAVDKVNEVAVLESKGKTPAELADIIGKEAADKIVERGAAGGVGIGRLEGLDLKVGGEGMRGFYDQILVRSANKLAKRWGGRVQSADVGVRARSIKGEQEVPLGRPVGVVERHGEWTIELDSGSFWGMWSKRDRALADAQFAKIQANYREEAKPVHSLVIPDAMRADVREEGFPRFAAMPAVSGTGEKQGFDIPDETRWQRWVGGFSNEFNRLEQIESAATTRVGGPETLAQALATAPGKRFGEGEKLIERVVRQQKRLLRSSKIHPFESTDALPSASDWLYVLHAPTGNAVAMKRHPRKFGLESNPGSGMSNSEAAAIVKKALASPQRAAYERLQELNRKLNRMRLDTLESGYLISKETRKAWEEEFGPDYVPLRTATDPYDTNVRGGAGFGVSGKESKRREGRRSKADSPLIFSLATAQEAIERKEANRVGNLLADLVRKNPDMPARVETDANKIKENEERLSFKENGEQAYIVTSDKGIAEGFRRIQSPDPGVIKVLDPVLGYWHAVLIKYNPVFPLTNVPKDIGTAVLKHAIGGGKNLGAGVKLAGAVLKNNLPAVKGAFKAIRNEKADGRWEKVYREARDAGGLIGWQEQFTYEKRIEDFEKALKPETKARHLGQLMEDVNRATELGSRLSTYDALRRSGKTPAEAAVAMRQITADFSRRGRWGPVYRRLYLFSGANVQGMWGPGGIGPTVAQNPRRAAVVLGALIGAGYLNALASYALGDDDEIRKLSDEDKARFFGVMVGKQRLGVMAPWGFNFFGYLGWKIMEVTHGLTSEKEALGAITGAVVDSFSPLPQGADPIMSAVPSVFRPGYEAATETDFAGRPTMPPKDPYARAPKPDSERYFQGVNPAIRGATSGLNRLTGGDEVSPGMIDVSPETVEHLIKAATGALGTFGGRTFEIARKVIAGDSSEIRISDIPIARPFVQEAARGAEGRQYYETLGELEEAQKREKAGLKLSKEQSRILDMESDFKEAEKELRGLREERDEAKSDATKKRLEREIRRVQERLVKAAR